MIDAATRRLSSLALVASLAVSLWPAAASATSQSAAHFAGSYVSTQVTGAAVIRLELRLLPNGRAQLRSGSSRYTQRPTAKVGTTVIQTGTWRMDNGRVVLHIDHSSTETDDKNGAQYEERSFVLHGCQLRMVGASAAFAFDKQHCT